MIVHPVEFEMPAGHGARRGRAAPGAGRLARAARPPCRLSRRRPRMAETVAPVLRQPTPARPAGRSTSRRRPRRRDRADQRRGRLRRQRTARPRRPPGRHRPAGLGREPLRRGVRPRCGVRRRVRSSCVAPQPPAPRPAAAHSAAGGGDRGGRRAAHVVRRRRRLAGLHARVPCGRRRPRRSRRCGSRRRRRCCWRCGPGWCSPTGDSRSPSSSCSASRPGSSAPAARPT